MLRMLISPTRSGSTAFLRCFENNPTVDRVYHQPVKSGFRQSGVFDYSFFSLDECAPHKVFVAKETVGGFERPETAFDPIPVQSRPPVADRFPSMTMIAKVKPLFLFRDPFETWNSINRLNILTRATSRFFSPFEFFVASYKNVFDFMIAAKRVTPDAFCLTLELAGADPHKIMREVCRKWNVVFYDAMIDWHLPYGVKTEYSEETKSRMTNDTRFKYSKGRVEKSVRFSYKPQGAREMTLEQGETIANELLPLYKKAALIAELDFSLP